ncbi:CheR family methyltransferase [Pelagicoccus albus]|uniref:PAS domain-containing protein n=1 Tax=Pelagicoccus albus TaxID=415222 RepID=A0A7X1EAC1_9BACT|nr:CheR family methyltransferase [Pelagicoccus albus]MBC2606622.1 PAS domain-containing protein [Pelagicoccus albus]
MRVNPDKTVEKLEAQTPGRPTGVVAIGCGKYDLPYLESLLAGLARHKEIAIVIVSNVSTLHTDSIVQLVAHISNFSVEVVSQSANLKSSTVYLNTPFHYLAYEQGSLVNTLASAFTGNERPFDRLLESIRNDDFDWVAVSLQGIGPDGEQGIQNLENKGFFGFSCGGSDTPETPEASPSDLAARISECLSLNCPSQETAQSNLLDRIIDQLERLSSIDFRRYKITTINRRIQFRMRQLGLESLASYLAKLEQSPEEVQALYHDLMIGVTHFFRDPQAFQILEDRVIPELFKNQDSHGREIRVWAPGVASGEEAYSLAILFDEYAQRIGLKDPNYRIFATDAHPPSIEKAMQGLFPSQALSTLTKDRKERYFNRSLQSYSVTPELRKKIVFAPHDLLKDPPFTKIDLVSCRNLLIYFDDAAQKKALGLILFALRQKGYLLLGASESPASYIQQIETIDSKWRVYRKSASPQIDLPVGHYLPPKAAAKTSKGKKGVFLDRESPFRNLITELMSSQMPAGIIISDQDEIIHTFGEIEAFFSKLEGHVSLSFDKLVRYELRLPMRVARKEALETRRRIETVATMPIHGESSNVTISVEPLTRFREFQDYVYVKIQTVSNFSVDESKVPTVRTSHNDGDDETSSLKQELQDTKIQLQETIHQLELSNKELMMANEELLTSNEELQSTNEELHSVNEELFSVNAEYELKNRELVALNEDIDNLLQSTEIGTIFIDKNLRIRKFTLAASISMNLLDSDLGRPIEHISHDFANYETLVADTQKVIEGGHGIEREIRTHSHSWFLLKISPFKLESGEVNGAVVTLVEISALKAAEERIYESQRKLKLALESADLGLWTWDLKNHTIDFDENLARILDLDTKEESDESHFLRSLNISRDALGKYDFNNGDLNQDTLRYSWNARLRSGEIRYLSARGIINRDTDGNVTQVSGIIWDETDVKRQEQIVLQKKNDLETLLYVISHDLREPLRAIRNFSRLLESRHSDQIQGKAKDFLQRINSGGERMSKLLDDVLSLSRISRMDPPSELIPGDTIVSAALKGLEAKINETKAQIVTTTDFPNIKANLTYATQALFNLVSNALKFVAEGKNPEIEISPYHDPNNQYTGFIVRDRGPGIPEGSEERVFRLFQRAVNRDIEGTGAGLAIVKQIATKHGGDLSYSAREGGGSAFTITFKR